MVKNYSKMNNASIIITAAFLGLIAAGATRKENNQPIIKATPQLSQIAPNYNYHAPKEQLPDYKALQDARDWLKSETERLKALNRHRQDSIERANRVLVAEN